MVSNNAKRIKPNDTMTNTSDALGYETWIIDLLIPSSKKTTVRVRVISSAIRSPTFDGSMKKTNHESKTIDAEGM